MHPNLAEYFAAAVRQEGPITIAVGLIDECDALYDPTTRTLRIDPRADPREAMLSVLVELVEGVIERDLAVVAGGGGATACGLVPSRTGGEGGGARLRLVGPGETGLF